MTSTESRVGRIVTVSLSASRDYPKYPQEKVTVGPHGIVGDVHAGELRPSHTNPSALKPNDRAISIVAKEVMDEVNETLGLSLRPGDFNENILVEGLGDLGDLKGGEQIIFGNGVVLRVTGQNTPCEKLEAYNGEGIIKVTVHREGDVVFNKRGIVATVGRTGELEPGETVVIQKV